MYHRTDFNNPLIKFLNVFMVLRQHSLLVAFKTWLKVSSQLLITTCSQAVDLTASLQAVDSICSFRKYHALVYWGLSPYFVLLFIFSMFSFSIYFLMYFLFLLSQFYFLVSPSMCMFDLATF